MRDKYFLSVVIEGQCSEGRGGHGGRCCIGPDVYATVGDRSDFEDVIIYLVHRRGNV